MLGDTTIAGRNYLNRKHFLMMLGVAAAIHMLAGVIWALIPEMKVNQIPVHVLNVKLGSGALMAMQEQAKAAKAAAKAEAVRQAQRKEYVPPPRQHERVEQSQPKVEQAKDAPVIKKTRAKPKPDQATAVKKGPTKNTKSEAAAVTSKTISATQAANIPSQYVRSRGDIGGVGEGSPLGNSTATEAEVMQRYTQLISIWLARHKVYPAALRSRGIHGKAMVRLRIDRSGNIKFFRVEKSTGYSELDDAVVTMVKAANPVPPVPKNYPAGNLIEFLIPVNYNLR